MAAPKTVLTYPLNGAAKDFSLPFEYLARKFVVVTLVGATRRVLTLNSEYRFTTKKQITTTTAWGPTQGFDLIEVRRVTSATERLVDFSDGSILRAYDLNTAQVQSLHIAEEARDLTADTIGVNNDGNLDARGRKLVNVADGVADGDAVNLRQQKAWAGSALNQANVATLKAQEAAASAGKAAGSAAESLTHAQNSYTYRVNSEKAAAASQASAGESLTHSTIAYQSRQAAYSSEQAASASATASQASAILSGQHAGGSAASAGQSAASAAVASRAKAETLLNVASYGALPVGSIVMAVRWKLFPGFLWLNGETFDAAVYPELAEYLGGNVLPNAGGRYLKFAAANEEVGGLYGGGLPAHSHWIPGHDHGAYTRGGGGHNHHFVANTSWSGDHAHGVSSYRELGTTGTKQKVFGPGPYEGDSVALGGKHYHTVEGWTDVMGEHDHGVTVNTAGPWWSGEFGTGDTVETNRICVLLAIKATGVKVPDLGAIIARIAALEGGTK